MVKTANTNTKTKNLNATIVSDERAAAMRSKIDEANRASDERHEWAQKEYASPICKIRNDASEADASLLFLSEKYPNLKFSVEYCDGDRSVRVVYEKRAVIDPATVDVFDRVYDTPFHRLERAEYDAKKRLQVFADSPLPGKDTLSAVAKAYSSGFSRGLREATRGMGGPMPLSYWFPMR